jgi:hypothetical protein
LLTNTNHEHWQFVRKQLGSLSQRLSNDILMF